MGTKLQYAINLLAIPSNTAGFAANCMDDWHGGNFLEKALKVDMKRSGIDKLQDSVDRVLEQHNIESIKKTMIMQEDAFKYQVQELHRLYSVQKALMVELQNEIQRTKSWTPNTGSDVNRYRIINQSVRDDTSSREQRGSCPEDALRLIKGFDLERPAEEAISTAVGAVGEDQAGPSSHRVPQYKKMGMDASDEWSEVELTLSIGGSTEKKRSKTPNQSLELGCSESAHSEIRQTGSSSSFKPDRGEECSDPANTTSSPSATFDQDRQRPHWLFQGLSMNRTEI